MNRKQKSILITVVAVFVAMFVYPPSQMVRDGTVFNMGYGWIFDLSKRGYKTINFSMLIIQWIGILVVGGIAFFLAKGESLPTGLSSIQSTVTTGPIEKQKDNESSKFLGGIYHPWRRYFARTVDYLTGGLIAYILFCIVVGLLMGLLLPDKIEVITKAIENQIIAGVILVILWMPTEAVLLSTVGNTFGKWLFGISVRTTSGQILSFSQAWKRSWGVLLQGMALGIPIVAAITEIFAYRRLTKTGTTLWDTATDCIVTHKTWSVARTIGCIGTFIFILILMGLLNVADKSVPFATSTLLVVAALVIGGFVMFAILYNVLKRKKEDHSEKYYQAEQAAARSVVETQRVATPNIPEVSKQDEEFIALFKFLIKENRLDNITDEYLLGNCKRAQLIASRSNNLDTELAKTINTFLEEIEKRGLSQEITKTQEISNYKESSLTKRNKEDVRVKVVFAILVGIVVSFILILLIANILDFFNNVGQNKAAVTETQESNMAPPILPDEGFVDVTNQFIKPKKIQPDEGYTDVTSQFLNQAATQETAKTKPSKETQKTSHEPTAEDWFRKANALCDEAKCTDQIKAIEYLNNAIMLQPNGFAYYYNRGGLFVELGQYQLAIKDYTEVIRLQPKFSLSYYNRGNTFIKLGQYQSAIKDFNETIRLEPDDSNAYNNRAAVYIMQGNNKLGCHDAQKACALGDCKLLEHVKGNGLCP